MPYKLKRPCAYPGCGRLADSEQYPSCPELTNGRYCSAVDITNFIKDSIGQDNTRGFYESKYWRRLRKEILKADKYECQMCKANGYYTKANHVHHINYVRKHPELALSKFYIDDAGNVKRNLVSTCKGCHETVCHPERLRWNVKEQLNVERW